MKNKTKKIICRSTHGADGYQPGTWVEGGRIFCGFCKKDISDDIEVREPIYVPWKWNENFWKWLHGERRFTGSFRYLSLTERIEKLPNYVNNLDEKRK